MLKQLVNITVWVLALNFLAAAAIVGYLFATKRIDHDKIASIRQIVTTSTASAGAAPPSTQPAAQEVPPDSPQLRMEVALAKAAGRPTGEPSTVAQTNIDNRSAVLERRLREIDDQRQLVQQARDELEKDRQRLLTRESALKEQTQAQTASQADKGFTDTLALYQSMPPKKTKEIFLSLDNEIVVRYLQAMEPRQAASILKEFKSPVELKQAQLILEKMRSAKPEAP